MREIPELPAELGYSGAVVRHGPVVRLYPHTSYHRICPGGFRVGLDVDFLPRPWIFLSFISLIFLPGERNISQNFFQISNFFAPRWRPGVRLSLSVCKALEKDYGAIPYAVNKHRTYPHFDLGQP